MDRAGVGAQPALYCRGEYRKTVLPWGWERARWGGRRWDGDSGNLDLGMMSGEPGHWVAAEEGLGQSRREQGE